MENQETNITIEVYRKVIEAEIQAVRSENLNLKVVIAQLQEDKTMLENTLAMAEKISKNDKTNVVSLADSKIAESRPGLTRHNAESI